MNISGKSISENQYPILIERLPLLIDALRPVRLADVDPRAPRIGSMESAMSAASLLRMVRLRRDASRPSLRPASFAFWAMLRPALLRPTVTAVAASNPAAAVPKAILAEVLMPRCDLRREPVEPPVREEALRPRLREREALADPPLAPRSAMVMVEELPREVRRREVPERVREVRDLVLLDPPEDRFALLAMAHLVLVGYPNSSTAKSIQANIGLSRATSAITIRGARVAAR